jgi:hypothetical protein
MKGGQLRSQGSTIGLYKRINTLSEKDDGVAIFEGELIDLWLDVGPLDGGVGLELLSLDFVVEVADVANDCVVLHVGG